MGYPDYPNNRLIVDGVDLSKKFGMILVDGYKLSPPKPKTYTVDIPGGNGKLDLTETLVGDTVYENRTQEFTFYIIDSVKFEMVKTDVSNFLHGKAFDYRITMDPDYIYHGRFTVSEYSHSSFMEGIVGAIKVSVDADPFKKKADRVFKIDAIGGIIVYLESGRMRVRPTVESGGYLKVIYNNKLITLQQGSWTINDLMLTSGVNEVYFNSYNIKNFTWANLVSNKITWGEFGTKRLYEWYKTNGDKVTIAIMKWRDVAKRTWSDFANTIWGDLSYLSKINGDNIADVYVKYEWGDL